MAQLEFRHTRSYLNQRTGEVVNDRNCCVPLAFAIALGTTYSEAQDYIQQYLGRKPNKGVNTFSLLTHLNEEAIVVEPPYRECPPTFNQFRRDTLDLNKTYIVLVRNHAFCIKQGIIYGNYDDRKVSRKRLTAVYEV